MGRPEGPGCYCFVNNILRNVMDTLSKNYRYVLIDCEAGLEHLSRRTTQDIDLLVIVVDSSRKSFLTAQTIGDLATSLKIRIGKACLIINGSRRATVEIPGSWLRDLKGRQDFQITVPHDPQVASFEADKRSILQLPANSIAYRAMEKGMDRMINDQ